MALLARTLGAGLPHHGTQRGSRREAIFFEDGEHDIYRDLLAEQEFRGPKLALSRESRAAGVS